MHHISVRMLRNKIFLPLKKRTLILLHITINVIDRLVAQHNIQGSVYAGTRDAEFGTGVPVVCCVTMQLQTAAIGLTLGPTPGRRHRACICHCVHSHAKYRQTE